MPKIIRRAMHIKACDVPKEPWGKFCIRNHYPYYKKGDYHHYEAKDATRIAASEAEYLGPRKSGIDARIEANELLYAMKHGTKFGNGKMAAEIREQWASRKITADNIADMAAKAENSKPSMRDHELGRGQENDAV
jgi:hypothetical protein